MNLGRLKVSLVDPSEIISSMTIVSNKLNMLAEVHSICLLNWRRYCPMLGFKSKTSLESTIAGYELIHMLRKGQFEDAGKMTVSEQFYALAA